MCGQQMVNNKSIVAILQGGLDIGNQSLQTTINGSKPIILISASPGPDTVAKNAYALNSAPDLGDRVDARLHEEDRHQDNGADRRQSAG